HGSPNEKSNSGPLNNQNTTSGSASMIVIPMDVDAEQTVAELNVTSASNLNPMNTELERHDYSPIQPYWFYSKKNQGRITWIPFSLADVRRLDDAYAQSKRKINK
ncbi:unnamed protein product, partial [Rotaria magnacalcarata]